MAHCGHGADPVALLEVVDRLLPQLGRQLDLEHARLGAHLDGEARVAEHLKHPAVGGCTHATKVTMPLASAS